jgi:ATP-dependent RNA helicase DeaD
VATLNQRYWLISGLNKLDTLSRILETETYDGMLIFMRTKTGTVELVEQLEKRGYAAEALNGDMKQSQREQTVNRFKSGKLNILIATDVAARGLDVDRISHVINYDIPFDTETYIHRVGRTGRAGRAGEAILFVAPRERHLLHAIEAATKQKIALMALPGVDDINAIRINRFKQRITDAIQAGGAGFYTELINDYSRENGVDPLAVAAALAKIVQGDRPLLLEKCPEKERRVPAKYSRAASGEYRGMERDEPPKRHPRIKADPSIKMECFRMEVGREHGVKCGNIVGAIANEAKLDSVFIQKVKIHKDFSTVELPAGIPKHVLHILKKARVMNRQLEISRIEPEYERGGTISSEPQGKDVQKASRNADEYSRRKAEKKMDKMAAGTVAKKTKKKAGLKKKSTA